MEDKGKDRRAEVNRLMKICYLKRIQAGLCRKCRAPRNLYATLCDRCQKAKRKADRKRLGCKKWRKGGPGRPPKTNGENVS